MSTMIIPSPGDQVTLQFEDQRRKVLRVDSSRGTITVTHIQGEPLGEKTVGLNLVAQRFPQFDLTQLAKT